MSLDCIHISVECSKWKQAEIDHNTYMQIDSLYTFQKTLQSPCYTFHSRFLFSLLIHSCRRLELLLFVSKSNCLNEYSSIWLVMFCRCENMASKYFCPPGIKRMNTKCNKLGDSRIFSISSLILFISAACCCFLVEVEHDAVGIPRYDNW